MGRPAAMVQTEALVAVREKNQYLSFIVVLERERERNRNEYLKRGGSAGDVGWDGGALA